MTAPLPATAEVARDMTDPVSATAEVVTDTATASTAALVQNADRLGLKWGLKPATVMEVGASIKIVYDGDTADITAVSMIGQVDIGDRVYVLFVPPSGNFIVGRVETASTGVLAQITSTGNTAFGGETSLLILPTIVFPVGRALQVQGQVAFTATNAAFALFLLRRGSGTGGTAIGEWEFPSAAGGVANEAVLFQRFVNTGTATTQLTLTGISTVGTCTTINAAPFGPCWFSVEDIGPAAKFSGLTSI